MPAEVKKALATGGTACRRYTSIHPHHPHHWPIIDRRATGVGFLFSFALRALRGGCDEDSDGTPCHIASLEKLAQHCRALPRPLWPGHSDRDAVARQRRWQHGDGNGDDGGVSTATATSAEQQR